MPTQAEYPISNNLTFPPSWTDDLPVCKDSGIGYSTNQIYRLDGHPQEEHPQEDRSFHWQVENICLYGVFDGHEGVQAATFALQRMAAEILLEQTNGKNSDEEIKEVLRQAFIAVERGYWDFIDDKLAERTSLQMELPDGMSTYEAYQNYPKLMDRLKALNYELSSGATSVLALIFNGKLYVANVGDCRALLCRTDSNGVLRVVQLSVDHDLNNEDELLRLSQLGLDVEKIRQSSLLGNQNNTRCLGNYLVKGGYKEFDELAVASSEPIVAEPEIHGGIVLDETCRFLLLLSDGLYKSLQEATGTEQVNKDIAQMAVEQFRVQSTLMGVAQAVVDKIVRLHHDAYMNGSGSIVGGKRDDITLLVRNFNFPMPHGTGAPAVLISNNVNSVRFDPVVRTVKPPLYPSENSNYSEMTATSSSTSSNRFNLEDSLAASNSSISTATSSMYDDTDTQGRDRNQRIRPYVDFSDFYANIEKARKEGTLPPELDI